MKQFVTMREKLSFGLGNFGINLQFGMTGFYLMYFYTDIYKIDAAVVGTVFLAARAIDAIFDPLMGLLIDRTRTRWGKHRPYLLFLALPYALSGLAVFAAPEFSYAGKIAYIFVTYTLLGILYSAVSLPLNSMLPTLTRDPAERNTINATREFLGTGSVVGIGFVTLPLVSALGGGRTGFFGVTMVFGVVTVVAMLVCFFNTRERVNTETTATPLTTAQSLRATRGNWPWIATMLVNFFFWVGYSAHAQSVVFYAEHVVGNKAIVPTLFLTHIASLVGTGASAWIANRVGKRMTGMLGAGIAALSFALIPVSNDIVWLIVVNTTSYIGVGLIGGLLFSLMADAVDFGEWRNGFRAQGLLFAASSFGVKLGMSIGGAFGAWLLARAGYVAGTAVTPAIVNAIIWGHVWLPAIAFVAMGASLLLFVFDPAYLRRLNDEAVSRNPEAETALHGL